MHSRIFQIQKAPDLDFNSLITEEDLLCENGSPCIAGADYVSDDCDLAEDIKWLQSSLLPTIEEVKQDTRKGGYQYKITITKEVKEACLKRVEQCIAAAKKGLCELTKNIKDFREQKIVRVDVSFKAYQISHAINEKLGFYFYFGKEGEGYAQPEMDLLQSFLEEDIGTTYFIVKSIDYHF